MKFGRNPIRQKTFLRAYLNWLCHMYDTNRPSLYLYEKLPDWWSAYNLRYEGNVTGFYSFENCDKFQKGIHILIYNQDLDTILKRLRHEWRHHWQYLYRNRLLIWWHQHESLYKRLHNQARCAIEIDAQNFAIRCEWHPSVCDEQLLTAFSEDDLSKIDDVIEGHRLAQRASIICNAMNDNQTPKRVWVSQTPADNRQYRSAWKGKKVSHEAPFFPMCKRLPMVWSSYIPKIPPKT